MNTTLHNGMILSHFEHKLSWFCSGLQISRCGTFILQHLSSNKVHLPLIETRLLWSLSHFLLPSRKLDSFSFGVLCSTFENSINMAKLGYDSDTMLDEHDSPQWCDIVHFEPKLLWLCFGLLQKATY